MMEKATEDKVSCLINPRAANSKWLRRKLLRNYIESKLPGKVDDVFGDTRTTVERAKAASADSKIIIAMGGDGTIADALQGIFEAGKEKDVLLGIIPFGSGNAFRKAFGIPKNPRRAIDDLAAGVPRTVDVIKLEDHYAGFASLGATARVTGEKLQHSIQGIWGHALAGRRLFGGPKDEYEIEMFDGLAGREPFDHKIVRSRFFDCIVAKTNYYGYSWYMAPKARLDDGYLDVTLFEVGAVKYALLFPLIYLGIFQRRQRHFKAKRVIVRGKNLPIQYNGEFLGCRDVIEFSIIPKAIRIICPPGRRGRRRFSSPE